MEQHFPAGGSKPIILTSIAPKFKQQLRARRNERGRNCQVVPEIQNFMMILRAIIKFPIFSPGIFPFHLIPLHFFFEIFGQNAPQDSTESVFVACAFPCVSSKDQAIMEKQRFTRAF